MIDEKVFMGGLGRPRYFGKCVEYYCILFIVGIIENAISMSTMPLGDPE
jgi:hypothetical protein